VIVYAGAIIVTFLFVIMLAQLEGSAAYDRAARSPARATITCFALLWCLIYVLGGLGSKGVAAASGPSTKVIGAATSFPTPRAIVDHFRNRRTNSIVEALDRGLRPTALIVDRNGREKPNTAGLGESLYSDHLISAGLAGVLLFIALVGAVAITNPGRAEEARAGPNGSNTVA
jgi:NADH-quinone oxidoreductase subunit J